CAAELDSELRSLSTRGRAGVAGAGYREPIRGSESEVRIMTRGLVGRVGRVGGVGGVGQTLLALALAASPALAATTVIRAGRLVDPAGKVVTNAVIVVDNDRIT